MIDRRCLEAFIRTTIKALPAADPGRWANQLADYLESQYQIEPKHQGEADHEGYKYQGDKGRIKASNA